MNPVPTHFQYQNEKKLAQPMRSENERRVSAFKSSQQQEGLKLSRCGAWQQKIFGLREQLRNSF